MVPSSVPAGDWTAQTFSAGDDSGWAVMVNDDVLASIHHGQGWKPEEIEAAVNLFAASPRLFAFIKEIERASLESPYFNDTALRQFMTDAGVKAQALLRLADPRIESRWTRGGKVASTLWQSVGTKVCGIKRKHEQHTALILNSVPPYYGNPKAAQTFAKQVADALNAAGVA